MFQGTQAFVSPTDMASSGQLCPTKINIVKNSIPHTPSKVGVLESITFSHTPDEAMSVGLAKACVPLKIYSVLEKLSFLVENQLE